MVTASAPALPGPMVGPSPHHSEFAKPPFRLNYKHSSGRRRGGRCFPRRVPFPQHHVLKKRPAKTQNLTNHRATERLTHPGFPGPHPPLAFPVQKNLAFPPTSNAPISRLCSSPPNSLSRAVSNFNEVAYQRFSAPPGSHTHYRQLFQPLWPPRWGQFPPPPMEPVATSSSNTPQSGGTNPTPPHGSVVIILEIGPSRTGQPRLNVLP